MIMTGSSFALQPVAFATGTAVPAAQAAAPAKGHFSFDDFLDIVNPLQHLPVVGTLYRAITHDHIDTPEKIIGDTLYGGFMGFVSSVADTAFEKITGHNFGDTVLGFLTGHHDDQPATGIASTDKPATQTVSVAAVEPAPASAKPIPAPTVSQAGSSQTPTADETALTQSLARLNTGTDVAQRALFAYRRANGTMPQAALSPF